MNARPSSAPAADVIDQICDAFERAWQQGAQPRMEAYLGQAAEPLRAQLWLELLQAELECRRRQGQTPVLEEYRQRFPERRDALDRLFEATTDDLVHTPPAHAKAAEPGQTVGGYELLGEIARGGMGVVYRARQIALNRIVAVKMILAGGHAGEEERARFRREAEAAARLQHPHIVQIHEIGAEGGLPFLSMEYVAGPSLAKYCNGTPLPARDAASLVETLARAVAYAHQQGIVHRDLKPGNILLSGQGSGVKRQESGDRSQETGDRSQESGDSHGGSGVGSQRSAGHGSADCPRFPDSCPLTPDSYAPKITDFGLAKLLDNASDATRTGMVVGTPSYMAPEQAEAKHSQVGPPADVYALGAILYELLTGRPPFKGISFVETVEQVRNAEVVPPRRLQPGSPRDLETICLTCLRKEPSRRYTSAEALADDLRRFQAGEPIQARPISAFERTLKWVKRRPLVASLWGAIVLLVTASLAVLSWQLGVKLDALADAERAREETKKESEAKLAGKDLNLARVHWSFNDIGKAREYVLRVPPEHRGAEWRHVHRLCHAELTQFPAPSFGPSYLGWHPDGEQVILFSMDSVRLLHTVTREERTHLLSKNPTYELTSVAQNGNMLFYVAERKSTKDKRELHTFDLGKGEPGKIHHVPGGWVLSPQGTFIAGIDPSVGSPQTVQVWEVATGKALSKLSLPKSTSARHLTTISTDGKRLACLAKGGDGTFYWEIWDLAAGKPIDEIPLPKRPDLPGGVVPVFSYLQFSPDGKRVLYLVRYENRKDFSIAPMRYSLHLAVIEPEKRHLLLARDLETNHRGAFSPDGTRVVWAGPHNTLVVGDADTGKEILVLRGHAFAVGGAAFSPDGRRLVSSSSDKTLRIWDTSPLP